MARWIAVALLAIGGVAAVVWLTRLQTRLGYRAVDHHGDGPPLLPFERRAGRRSFGVGIA